MMTERENIIQLKKNDNLKLRIVDAEGNDTGEYLEFDVQDIELPLKYQELIDRHNASYRKLKMRLTAIDKKEDHRGKKILSKNEEEKFRALKEYFQETQEEFDMFLGENGCKKLLQGRKLGWETIQEIDEIIVEQIGPHIQDKINNLDDAIMKKYQKSEENVIE